MRHRGFRQLVMLDVTSDTDDLQRWTIRSRRQSLSESVSAGKESLGQRFVDDHNAGSAFAILVGEAASLGHLDAHRLVIIGTRSEEHTSELQSQSNLVCRLLLEKKKIT